MFNLKSLKWDEEALHVAGITDDKLSKLVPTTHSLTGLDEELANEMNVLVSTPFVVGASDGVLSNLGVNAMIRCCGCYNWYKRCDTCCNKSTCNDPKGRIFVTP